MAIESCRECNGLISTRALICPNCGAPVRAAFSPVMAGHPVAAQFRPHAGTTRSHISWLAICAGIGTVTLILMMVFLRPAILQSQGVSSHVGNMWWPGDRSESVVVYSNQHQSAAPDLQVLQQWEDNHEACLANAGARAEVLGSDQLSFTKVSVMVTEGDCAGFRGWVPAAVWHDSTQ